MVEALLAGDRRCLESYSGAELFGEKDNSLFTFPFSSLLFLMHTYKQRIIALRILTSGNISKHVNESFIVYRILLNYGYIWNLELFRCKISQNFPETCVWVSSDHHSRMVTLWWLTEQTHSSKIHICTRAEDQLLSFLLNKGLLCLNKNCVLYAQQQRGVWAVMSKYTMMSPQFTKNYS